MKKWKSKKITTPGLWTSEILLEKVDAIRLNKVKKLIKDSGEEFEESDKPDWTPAGRIID